MDYQTIISLIPKLAATVLIILGILIVLEIRAMVTGKKKSEVKPKEPDVMTVVQFPKSSVKEKTIDSKKPFQASSLIPLLMIPVIVIFLLILVTFLTKIEFDNPFTLPQEKPDESIQGAVILIYESNDPNEWKPLSLDDLSNLTPGKEIKVVVSSNKTIKSAQFTINGEVLLSGSNRTPRMEPYVAYTIKPGVYDYYIAVSVQYE